jgi:hypothetical protein
VAFEDFDQGGLAGIVRAQQGKHFTFLDLPKPTP